MNIFLKTILILLLTAILYQDLKERLVYIILFALTAVLLVYLQLQEITTSVIIVSSVLNICVVGLVILILSIYSKIRLKKPLKETFGMGDGLFFILLALGFPTATFLVLFSFSLLFSYALFLVLKSNLKVKTVPLAGFQALFLAIVLLLNESFSFVELYTI
ncbi:MAG: hypothetical protein COB73_07745 [Flavobacteriaceae bacterium]|nr:MAG: hypothetical protein COB73_07745 [Flavobacteriaceae bacterium]